MSLLLSARDEHDASARIALNTLLRKNSDARAVMAHLMVDEISLISRLRDDSIVSLLEPEPAAFQAPKHNPMRWLSWHSLRTAVAGIVLGIFSASLVFGYGAPRAVSTVSRFSGLVDGSFEKQTGRLPSGFPVQFGVWSGDQSEVIQKPLLDAKDGNRALRFVRAELEPAFPNYGASSCDVYQLVDLRSLKADTASDEATLELSVQFLDKREAEGDPVLFITRVHVFGGTPDALLAEWPLTQKEALASGSSRFDSKGGSPRTWHQVTTKVPLSPQADFAVVHLLAHKPRNPRGTEAVFGEQFADDVRLTLKTQPKLPVRLGQR